jgi:F-type H+-transporting ATPase subunit delta
MGSATREALASAVATLGAQKVDLATGEQLLSVARLVGGSASLRAALADDSADDADKRNIVGRLFGSYTPAAKAVLETVVSGRWSNEDELVAGLEELGIRAIAESAPKTVSIESELFEFERAVNSDAELELAVGSKLGTAAAKASLVESLLGAKASKQTVEIVSQLVQQPRGRRIGELMRFATTIVADQAGQSVATVTAAAPIAPAQLKRLADGLGKQYGRELSINLVLDPAIIGGLRIQIGDDVIDGSIASRLNDLRLQLAR